MVLTLISCPERVFTLSLGSWGPRRSSTCHIRAVLSSEQEASLDRERLKIIWLTSLVCPLGNRSTVNSNYCWELNLHLHQCLLRQRRIYVHYTDATVRTATCKNFLVEPVNIQTTLCREGGVNCCNIGRQQEMSVPSWHLNCLWSFLSGISQRQTVPSKLADKSHLPDFENWVANIGPFSTDRIQHRLAERHGTNVTYLMLLTCEIHLTWWCTYS